MTGSTIRFDDDYKGDDGSTGAFNADDKPGDDGFRYAHDALMISVDRIFSNPQVREEFDEGQLNELATSLENQGQIQAIVVKKKGDRWLIVSGERRWRAAKQLGWKEVRCDVREIGSEAEFLEVQIAENTHRKNLNPIEKAKAYQRLYESGGGTYTEIGKRFGVDPSSVQKDVKLLRLAPKYQKLIAAGKLKKTYAAKAAAVDDPEEQARMLEEYLRTGDGQAVVAAATKKGTKTQKAATSRGTKRRRQYDDITINVTSQKRKPIPSLSAALRQMADELDAEVRGRAA